MSRERKVNFQCNYCGKCGVGYRIESYRNNQWETDSEVIPDGWSDYGYGIYLCSKCDDNPKAVAKVTKKVKTKNSVRAGCLFTLASFIILCLSMGFFYDSEYMLGIVCIAMVISNIFVFKAVGAKNSGCAITVMLTIIEMGLSYYLLTYSDNHVKGNNVSSTSAILTTKKQDLVQSTPKSKLPAYLQNIDDMKYCGELSTFYFNIASGFYNDDMGLKGTPEQIKAGNKIMLEVYDFLGTSARAKLKDSEADMNVDSMKSVIKNFSGVSDFRKKKALEELQLGVDKIKSIK